MVQSMVRRSRNLNQVQLLCMAVHAYDRFGFYLDEKPKEQEGFFRKLKRAIFD